MEKVHLNKREILELIKSRQITSEEGYKRLQKLRQEQSQTESSQAAYYRSVWEKQESAATATDISSGRYLIFDVNEELYNAWQECLKKQGNGRAAVLLVQQGERFRELGNGRYEINPTRQEEYERLVQELAITSNEPLHIVHGWSIGRSGHSGRLEDDMQEQLKNGGYSLFFLAKALLAQSMKIKTKLLYVYTYDKSAPHPLQSAAGGLVKSLNLESSRLEWKSVGIATANDLQVSSFAGIEMLLGEFAAGMEDADIRYEGGSRFVQRLQAFEQYEHGASEALPLQEGGVYVIAGGAGGLGLIFAEYLARQVKARLVLVGRTDADARKLRKFQELEALGAQVMYVKADLSKKSDVQDVIDKALTRFKTINGIIQSAGMIRDALVSKKTKQEMEEVLASKVYGTVYLDEATQHIDLDFFVCFSSIASINGNLGQCDYAFANNFLDAFAVLRSQSRAGKTISINWPLWEDGGMQMSREEREILVAQSGLEMLPSADGVEAWKKAFASGMQQFVVVYGRRSKLDALFLRRSAKPKRVALPMTETLEVDSALLAEKADTFLKETFSDLLKLPVERLDERVSFQDYGIDSILIKKFNILMERKSLSLPKTLLFEHQTLGELKRSLLQDHEAELVKLFELGAKKANGNAKVEQPLAETRWQELRPLKASRREDREPVYDVRHTDDVAIIGMSGSYPGAKNLDEFWDDLAAGKDRIGEIPRDRWEWRDYFDPNPERAKVGKSYSKWGAFLEGADRFDPLFFNISPKEAELMDPQERLFLQTAWAALEDAGYTRKQLREAVDGKTKQHVGVFVGVTTNTYLLWGPDQWRNGHAAIPQSMPWSIANRVSFVFNFSGPSMPIDTACSSALTAIHLACESLKKGECQVALAGGVNLYLHPSKYVSLCQTRMLSPTGKCHSFGADGDGFVPGEGVGTVLLKPLQQAIADGDHIYGVIKGTAINHGGSTSGYTVPNPKAQAELLADAISSAGINPRTVTYIEAHGTGTSLGDPIEIAGLTKAFGASTSDRQFCAVGSVKSNIGHLEAAAGIASLTKVLLQMKHKKLVPSLHSERLNPNIDFATTPFYVQQRLEDWHQPTLLEDGRHNTYLRRAGISSFGAGGANAHILIEEYQKPAHLLQQDDSLPRLFVLSAQSEQRMREYAGDMAHFLKRSITASEGDLTLDEITYTMQVGREAMNERLAFVVSSTQELHELLNDYHHGRSDQERFFRGSVQLNVRNGHASMIDAGNVSLEEVAALWVAGAELNWRQLYRGTVPQRVSLPTYPFEQDRYWIPQADKSSGDERDVVSKLHPLVGANISTLTKQKFSTRMTGKEFYLQDHVVAGRKVLPGVAYLEMARAAAEIAAEHKVCRIKDVIWAKPVTVAGDPVDVQVDLEPAGEWLTYEVSTVGAEGSTTVHARGSLGLADDLLVQAAEFVNLQEIKNRCSEAESTDECYAFYEAVGFEYGPSFKAIRQLFRGDQEALSYLELPKDLELSNTSFVLHPSMLDGALQTVCGCVGDAEELYLPYSIGEVEIREDLPKTCFAHVIKASEQTDMKTFHVNILGEDGRVLVRIKEFMLRAFKQDLQEAVTPASVERLSFSSEWTPAALPQDIVCDRTDTVVVFDRDQKVADQLRNQAKGCSDVVLVLPGTGYQKREENLYEIDPASREDYQRLIESLTESGHMPTWYLNLWSEPCLTWAEESVHHGLERGVYSLLYLSQALMTQRIRNQVRVAYVYQSRTEECQPQFAAVSGFAKALQKENPLILCKTIEIIDDSSWTPAAIAECAWLELHAGDEVEVRYENSGRFVSSLQEVVQRSGHRQLPLREKGVYLITGGLGGLGLIFAEFLAEKYRAKIVLTGRSALDADKARKIAELERMGAEVLYLPADVSKQDDVERVAATSRSRFGRLNGVLHSAGVLRDSFVIKKTREEMEAVLGPKVYGTLHLDSITAQDSLDFFCMFSSVSAVMGNIGQSDYAFGNSFMDHFASWRSKRRPGSSISINWPLWENGGMNVDAETKAWFQRTLGMAPLKRESGILAWKDALVANLPQVLVLEGNGQQIRNALAASEAKENPKRPVVTEAVDDASEATLDEAGQTRLHEKTQDYLKELLAYEIRLPAHKIVAHEPMEKYGIDSVMIMSLTRVLEQVFGELPKTLFFEYSSIAELTGYFLESHREKLMELLGEMRKPQLLRAVADKPQAANAEVAGVDRSLLVRKSSSITKAAPEEKCEDIAIIGVSGSYPMARNLDEFMENLRNGTDCIGEVPKDRWNHQEFFDPDKSKKGKTYSKWGGFIDDVDKFDPLFFNISPREAELMDPQERLFLQTVWHSMEDAGYTREQLSQVPVGVFVGVMYGHYQLYGAEESARGNVIALSSSYSSIANRVSYCFNFRGPSVALDTMCSSSLTAIHFACDSLRRGESEVAVAGGVNVTIHPNKYILLSQGKFIASDGRCRSFGEGGDGYVPGEGVGAVLLKPLDKAVADGDRIYAVIKGSSLNHGGKTNGYTVPNPTAQGSLIAKTLNKAQIDARTITYVEAHGTGTSLGDPIEILGLAKAFREHTMDTQFCAIGSAKSNIGHLESAAGIAAVTKVLLQFQHKQLLPSIHSDTLNPHINFQETPFYVQQKLEEWKRPVITENGVANEYPRRAGISSFGAGGSNAHLILEEYVAQGSEAVHVQEDEDQVIVLSARNEDRLLESARQLLHFLRKNSVTVKREEPLDERQLLQKIQQELVEMASDVLQVDVSLIGLTDDIDEYGFDPLSLTEFMKRVNERYETNVSLNLTVQVSSFQAMAEYLCASCQTRLKGTYTMRTSEAVGDLSLVDLAYTLQVGREAMDERLALVVSSVEELAVLLASYCDNGKDAKRMYRGSVKTDMDKVDFLFDNQTGEEFIRTIIRSRDAHKLTRLWSYGVAIDWKLLHAAHRPQRIALPLYPFAKERYWVPVADKADRLSVSGHRRVEKLHPLLDRNVSDFEEQKFVTRLVESDFILSDHVIAGRQVLPGATYLEMARAAGELAAGGRVKKMNNIVWWKAAALDDQSERKGELEIHTSLYPLADAVEFEVWSDNGTGMRTVHGQGQLMFAETATGVEILDLDAIKARGHSRKNGDEMYREFEEAGFVYGNRLRAITGAIGNDCEYLAKLELPAELTEEFDDYVLHPALIDGAFQAVSLLTSQTAGPSVGYLPVALGEVEILSPLSTICYVYVTERSAADAAVRKFDLQIADEAGHVQVSMKDFSVRALASAGELRASNEEGSVLYCTSDWTRRDLETESAVQLMTGDVMMFVANEQQMQVQPGLRVIQVKPGTTFRETGRFVYEINPARKEDYARLLATLKQQGFVPERILHLWSQDTFCADAASLGDQLAKSVYSVLYICQEMMEHFPRNKFGLAYLYAAGAEEQPVYAALGGFAKTLNQENPNIVCKTLEIDTFAEDKLLERTLHEFAADDNVEIRYRDGGRFVRHLISDEVAPDATHALPLKTGGVYLITGGAGGLGWIFAEYLAQNVKQVKIVLTGRSDLDAEKRAKLQLLANGGTEVVYEKADVSNHSEVERMVHDVKARFGTINGVLHSAGVLRDSFVKQKTEAEMVAVLAPKVYGTVHLEQAIAGDDLDFFVMFSSVAAVLGNVGQCDYAFGNSFMDHFATLMAVRKPATKYLSINWPLWRDGGMSVTEEQAAWLRKSIGLVPLDNHNGIKALEDGLRSNRNQLMVVQGEQEKIRKFLNKHEERPILVEVPIAPVGQEQKTWLVEKTESFLKDHLSAALRLPANRIEAAEPLESYGIDSVMIMELTRELEAQFGELSKTLFFEYLNIADLAGYFMENHTAQLLGKFGIEKKQQMPVQLPTNQKLPNSESNQQASTKRNRFVEKRPSAVAETVAEVQEDDIAIIGVSGRYPLAANLSELWENLKAGRDCITEIPKDRWDFTKDYDPDKNKKGKTYGKWGGFIDDVDKFDPLFFNISPKEAQLLDPQERLFLQTVWHTLEDAGYTRERLSQALVGVYVGVMYGHYQMYGAEETLRGNPLALHSSYASIANRVSYFFNFHGPSMAVDTMCSSSLTAIHLACESLRRGESEVAIAGGVNVSIHPNKYLLLGSGKFLSSDGRCRSFGEDGDGYVPGEGVGAVLLKPLRKAMADGDCIYAVIKASTLSHGGKTNGYTVPNPTEQANLIAKTLKKAKINPRTIGYVEAHGTGTSLGDPIEITGLMKAFREYTEDTQFCAIGSAKSNIGHLESAAGIVGLTKVLLQFRYKQLAPSIHSETLNPHIPFQDSSFYVPQTLEEWHKPVLIENEAEIEYPRRAGLSSFGAGGSNAHLILEEYEPPTQTVQVQENQQQVIVLSARTEERLQEVAEQLLEFLQAERDLSTLTEVAYTLQVGREAMEERLAFVVSDIKELTEQLGRFRMGQADIDNTFRGNSKTDREKVGLFLNDKMGAEIVSLRLQEQELHKLAQLWVCGMVIDWSKLYAAGEPQRITLPLYPFAKERYWVPTTGHTPRGTVPGTEQFGKLHPLIGQNTSDLKEQKFNTRLTRNDACLADHEIGGRKMLPGAAYLEMACAAGELAGDSKVRAVKNIAWWTPAALGDQQEQSEEINVAISLYQTDDAVNYEVWSSADDDTRTVHGQGQLEFAESGESEGADEHLDLDAINSRCFAAKSGEMCYREFEEAGFLYGPSFQTIQEVVGNAAEALSRLELSTSERDGLNDYILHPMLVDGAFQTVAMMIQPESGAVYVPFSVGKVLIMAPLPTSCYAYVTEKTDAGAAVRKFDIRIADEQGHVRVHLIDFAVRRLMQEREPAGSDEEDSVMMELLEKLETGEVNVDDAEQLIGVMLNG